MKTPGSQDPRHALEVARYVDRRLNALGDPSADELIGVAGDKGRSDDDRSEAISLLGLLKESRAITHLLDTLKEDKHLLSWASAVALGQIGSSTAVGPLLEVLRSSASAETRRAAIHALGLLGDRRAASGLVRVLEDLAEPATTRGEAAEALSTCGLRSPRALAALTRALADPSAEVRFWSAYALGQYALLTPRSSSHKSRMVAGLRRLVRDGTVVSGFGSVGQEAADALRRFS